MLSFTPTTGARTEASQGPTVPACNGDLTPVDHLLSILQELEVEREQRWKRQGKASELKLHWRAAAIQHMFSVVPGETILEFGAGSGLLTEQLSSLLQGENPITSVVFSQELLTQAARRGLPRVDLLAGDCLATLPSTHYDYVIGSGMLWHPSFMECLRCIHRVLKPGGQMIFFEPNFRFPARLFNEM
jgi:2-polyprenyl-3-methyl-5-hydroxy-6-metoxy-1,4-benzoquinol methylase